MDFEKQQGLIPAIIQDSESMQVLMLGYMNKEAYQKTIDTKLVTFYSRSRKKLWTKGETSGNYLELIDIKEDCDKDTLLIKAKAKGPVCHTGSFTCWNEEKEAKSDLAFLNDLEEVIEKRKNEKSKNSYISELFGKGINKIAQKVGEEAVELVIEAKDNNDELFLNEAADLLFHQLILLNAKGFSLKDVTRVLEKRRKK